jgi:class 3 adenylate cyclase/tetratricopeptide (TPR) repeat protein
MRCDRCGADGPEQANFCARCGARTGASDEAKAERRQITVAFCDIVGSTPLSQALDPEDLREVLREYQTVCESVTRQFEGHVAQHLGDGALLYFGYPVAHEDDAHRAVLAALEIVRRVESLRAGPIATRGGLQVRVGIHSGLVVIGEVGAGGPYGRLAHGETPNIAARTQAEARPNTVLVTEATKRLLRGSAEVVDQGARVLRGVQGSIRLYEVSREKSAVPELADRASSLTPLAGRSEELCALLDAWARVREGVGKVVSVSGEAGLGKSRLILELRQAIAGECDDVLEGSCFVHGDMISFLPFLEIIKRVLSIQPGLSQSDAIGRIDEQLGELQLDRNALAPALRALLSLPIGEEIFARLPAQVVRERTVQAIRSVLVARAQRSPTVVIVEDLHWIDKATEDALGALVDALPAAPLLLVLVFRPEYVNAWEERLYHSKIVLQSLPEATCVEMLRGVLAKPHAINVTLARLSPEDSASMVRGILRVESVPPALVDLVARLALGNPLFVEELTLALLESGQLVREGGTYTMPRPVDSLALPTNVQGVFLTRTDRLRWDLKELLRGASAIGRVFDREILRRIAAPSLDLNDALRALQDMDFIHPVAGDPKGSWSFKHVLTQQALYGTLVREDLAAFHERVGEAYEQAYPQAGEENCELLAYHYARSTNRGKAVHYLHEAQRKAVRVGAMAEAEKHFAAAMQRLDDLPETRPNQRYRIELLADEVFVVLAMFKFQDYYDQLRKYEAAAVALGDNSVLGVFYSRVGWCQWAIGEFGSGIETLRRAAELSSTSLGGGDTALAQMTREWCHLDRGEFNDALSAAAAAREALERRFDLQVWTRYYGGLILTNAYLGRWRDAIEAQERAVALGEKYSDPTMMSYGAWLSVPAYLAYGDAARARRVAEYAVRKATNPADDLFAHAGLALVLARTEGPDRAVERLTQAVGVLRSLRFAAGEFFALCLGELLLRAGRLEQAKETVLGCIAVIAPCGMRYYLAWAERVLGEVALSEGAFGPAEKHFECAIREHRAMGAQPELALALAGHARLKKRTGRHAEARDLFDRARTIHTGLEPLGQ